MDFLERLAERRILEALERGELDDLPGHGAPLPADEAALPADEAALRSAYRLLKNAGHVPPEVECLREIGELERFVAAGADSGDRRRAARRLQLLWQRLEARSPGASLRLQDYRARILARVAGREDSSS